MASGPQAGWYPDPDDTPDRYRWFDGERWTDRTVTSPEPSPQRGGKGPRGNNGGHGSGWVWAIIAVVLVVAVIAALGLRQRTASDHHAEPGLCLEREIEHPVGQFIGRQVPARPASRQPGHR